MNAQAKVVEVVDGDVFKTISENSSDAALVFLGVRPPGHEESIETYAEYLSDLTGRTRSLQRLVKVLAAEEIDFQGIFK